MAKETKYTKTSGGRTKTATVTSVPEAGRVAVQSSDRGRLAHGEASADPAARAAEIGRDLKADGWAES